MSPHAVFVPSPSPLKHSTPIGPDNGITAPEVEGETFCRHNTPFKIRYPHPYACTEQRNLRTADLNKIVKAIDRCCEGLDDVDTIRIAMNHWWPR